MYESSKMQYMQILGRLTDFRRELYRDLPRVITPHIYTKKEIQEVLGDIPNLETLFGSLDYCDCEHCKSLYGPAAYFTDMLRFLKEHNSLIKQGGKTLTVKDILFLRRPDLGNIKLNCENTNTALPYIDLVCEILENNIAPQQKNFSYQTTLSQRELRAIPQYIRPHAYTVLATADFPMNVSFNLGQEEARTYLNFLRVPRHELMEAFQDKSNINNKIPDDVSIAAEYFGTSSKEKDLIVTQRQTAVDQNKYWGFDTTQSSIAVSLLMKRTKLSYYELLELLLVKFVNDPAAPSVSKIERPLDTCDTEQQTVSNLTVFKFDLMHRFIRLWRKTGWKMWELDLLIRNEKINPKVNNVVEINGGTLVNLKRLKQLQEKLRLPFETLLAFYGEINREIRINPEKPDAIIQPFYNKIFQNKAISGSLDKSFEAIDNLDENLQPEDKSQPFNPLELDNGITLGVNGNGYSPVPTILSALSLQQSDFDLLADKTDNHLSVLSLSVLSRYAYLARSLKLSVKDLLLLLGVTNVADPFTSLQTTLDCIKYFEHITSSGLTLRELDYILNYNPESPIGLREEALSQIISALRNILETNKEKIEKFKLSVANRAAILAFDTAVLLPLTTKAQMDAALTPLKTILILAIENFTAVAFSVQETNAIIHFNSNSLTDASKANLIENIKALQLNLTNLFDQNKNQIKSQVAASFGITDEQASVILEKVKVLPGPASILQKLEDESLLEKAPDGNYREINPANFSEHFALYGLLHKIAILISKMRIETKDLEWFIVNRTDVDTLDFSALPVSAVVNPNDFGKWYNLYRFLDFKSKFPEPENASIRSILDLAKNANNAKATIIGEIAKLTQWETTEITATDTGLKFQHVAGNLDYTKAENYHRLLKCFEQMILTGVGAATMLNWTKVTANLVADLTIGAQTRQAVKSKYEQDDWLQKVTPLQDDIREKKRMALVAYHLDNSQRNEDPQLVNGVITNPLYWKDSNSLYKYFLIDVEMSACQPTSRIKQALSSIQLFVQRCFLNLEKRYVEVTQDEKEDKSSPNAWSQWKWMKNYGIWEVNRKIFFYPENWLEPELRDDKSPFFKELENELMQNEITSENVEEAFKNYLYKVDEVSHLEVCGLYHQMEDLDLGEVGYETNIVHVIGRTKTIPHIYYYRTYDMNYNTWAAWEKVDVDISGDQVVPVVYNRKLYLFWLQFMEKPMKAKKVPAAQPTNGPTTSPEPMKVMEIQLGWSIKKSGGWTPKKISKQKLIHPWERPHHSYNLKPYYLAKFNELYLDIYLSTSQEFNDNKFYDPLKIRAENPVYLTINRSNETYLPWHSSAFVFNGDVKEVKLKGLERLLSNSYTYVHENFGADGVAIKQLDPKFEYGPRLKLPEGMHFENTHLTNNKRNSKNDKYLKVLENTNSVTLLGGAISPFELVITQQDLQLNTLATDHPLFYQDHQRVFFIKPEWRARLGNYGQNLGTEHKYRFMPFYHPYTVLFIRELNRDGIDGLLNRKIQIKPESFPPKNNFNFDSYSPTNAVIIGGEESSAQKKTDIVDFSFSGAYSIYNWELFFHAPLMVACRLMQNQKFEDAMHWFHYIFNPTDIEKYDIPQRYWVTKPFFNYNSNDYRKQRIESILSDINQEDNSEQLKAWRNNPFKPHVVARYRPVAYQKNVVMKYLDNLIAWGDMLFKRDTIESINEASLLYMLAYEILGDRPQKVPNVKHEELTFNELEPKLDEFGNARVDVVIEDTLLPITVVPTSSGAEPIPKLETFYFCIPHNDYLTKYWDKVEDRLFKIRHCMNIEGIVRQLPLFEPPIDPALLVKAAAAGIDFGSVLNDLSAPTPYYRFRIVVQKAIDFCNEVKILGENLLSALEKKDVEHLSLLRSQHEIQLLEAVKEVRKKQIDEAVETVGSLNKAFEMAEERKTYYEGKPDLVNVAEGIALGLSSASLLVDVGVITLYGLAGGFKAIPNFKVGGAGFGGTPSAHVETGGGSIGGALEMAASTLQSIASALDKAAALSSTIGSYQHRKDDWDFQSRLAIIEKDQIQFQINAAQIRQAVAEKELENQELQIDNTKTVDDYMRNKFSNEQLYNWMITQISTVYFQAYQLAYDMAKKAEKCYQYELGITDSNIIQFGYWDSLKKGLLSGDKLMNDLRRLEAEYINQNRREFEITKHISFAQMAPLSLITLKETGKCIVSLPEWIFDMDYPGHYMRRIKSVSISIPCIVGPYTGINCMLSLLRNETRMEATLSSGKYEKQEDDTRFKAMFGAISSIATSHAQRYV
jgi:Tc toxin complex TcA C-terminal TcB-binding domain/Neuraminidase-like domain